MAKTSFWYLSLATTALAFTIPADRAFSDPSGVETAALAAPAAANKWAVSGYLASAPTQKVYVTVEGKFIEAVGAQAPADVDKQNIIETSDLIFPGLIDMHGHIKYNILPLWSKTRGQFLNRFEWRKWSEYKNAVSFNMKPIRGDTVCAAVRWAEIKAMTGGAVAMQGIGGDAKCAKEFGVKNLEIAGEFENKVALRGMTDMVVPGMIGATFKPFIEPIMTKKKVGYDAAYKEFLGIDLPGEDGKSSGWSVAKWVEVFVKEQHNLANAQLLLTGRSGLAAPKDKADILSHYPEKEQAAVTKWVDAYLAVAKPDDKKALDMLGMGGVKAIPSHVRRYINMFHNSNVESLKKSYADPAFLANVAHLSEGMRNDVYNKEEYHYAQKFGMAKDGLVVIHGVGMNAADFADAKKNNISIVWSPFSNLLLYNETLDVAAALKAGVNIALGVDWTPTGSKTILDELKIARNYIDRNNNNPKAAKIAINDQQLVEMATVNAAKAMKRQQLIGKVEAGYLADFILVKATKGVNPYTKLVKATQADMNLVVVGGQPQYGEEAYIKDAAEIFGDKAKYEVLPKSASRQDCGFTKALRLPYMPASAKSVQVLPAFWTAESIEKELAGKFKAYAASVKEGDKKHLIDGLDPIFNCEDGDYTKRFADFVRADGKDEMAKNLAERADIRKNGPDKEKKYGPLNDSFNPLGSGDDDGDEDEQM
ncbi:MAG: amidohydrolase family protein [Bacteriovoracia bacterium]